VKVLLVRADRLGDLVLSLPAVAWLRQARPDWELHALVAAGAEPIVEHDPALDAFYTWDGLEDPELERRLRAERYDAAVLLQYQTPLARLLHAAGIPRRYGPLSKPASLIHLNRGRWQRRSRVRRHERDYNVDLVRPLAGRAGRDVPVGPPRLHLAPAQRQLGAEVRAAEAGGAETVALIHPGSGGSALDWQPRHFADVANTLVRRRGWRVMVTGSHHDRLAVDALAPALDPEVTVIAERYPLREFLGVVSAADVMIAPSTGPLHVAAGLGLAAVGLYPPAPTMSPRRWGPLGPWCEALTPPVDCPAQKHCLLEACLLYNCLEGLPSHRVAATAVDLATRRQRELAAAAAAPDEETSR
jgi:ADP-heptose:LPS heptosyltransferase